ncbi:hypothetical protein Lpp227_02756 [Lacticaseibacillus paracasei subsp. paracasei Lpp227]|nr:hypothetical protein Lpp227_02756 [Lacticaseibacillus paracasei subsp. paracasei Lpp227]
MVALIAQQPRNLTQVSLDPAAMMFVMGRTKHRPYRIRLSLRLKIKIDVAKLQLALDQTVIRYPIFFVKLVRRFNRCHFEPVTNNRIIQAKESVSSLGRSLTERHCEARVSYMGS